MQRASCALTKPSAALLLGAACLGCGGSGPLLHPAHVLHPGKASIGSGVSGEMILAGARAEAAGATLDGARRSALEELTVAPGVAPWVGARVGVEGSNEVGLAYTGRALRVSGRHAFSLGEPTLSAGLGVAALLAERPGEDSDGRGAYGAGLDVPVLLGFQSTADIYSLWLGPRLGFELVQGKVGVPSATPAGQIPTDASGQHLQLGFVLGVRAGLRHVHVALEVDATYHRAWGEIGGEHVRIEQATIAPGGGLSVTF
jgi:hypothetical protein